MPQFDSGAAEPIGRFSEGLLLRLLQFCCLTLSWPSIFPHLIRAHFGWTY